MKGSFGIRHRQGIVCSEWSLTRISSALTPSTSARAALRSAPCRTRAFDQRLAGRAISVKEPLNPNYISISLWGFFSIQRSAAFFVPTDPEPRRPRRVTRVARSCKRSKLAPEAGRNGDRPRAKAVLTKDILFGMNILTLAGFAVMGLTITLNRMGQAGKALSIGLMAAGTVLVFLGLYAGGWSG